MCVCLFVFERVPVFVCFFGCVFVCICLLFCLCSFV